MPTMETKPVIVNLPSKLVHISPSGAMWTVRLDSSMRARRVLATKQKALEFVRPLQQKGFEVAVHNKTGMVDFIIDSHGKKY